MISVISMYNEFRVVFPELTEKVDKQHFRLWGDIEAEFTHSWFESLANSLNDEMSKGAPVKNYIAVYEFIRKQYHSGDTEIKNCVDVCFTENLFWQVDAKKAEPYWNALPEILKQLYIAFHRSKPV